jgi:chromosome segregation ATPase
MSDTPRTDNAIHDEHDPYEAVGTLCHELERELNAANTQIGLLISGSKQQERKIEFLQGRVKELEDQLNSANKIIRQQQLMDEEMLELQNRIQRLVEEGDEMLMWLGEDTYPCNLQWLQDQWTKAKEGL